MLILSTGEKLYKCLLLYVLVKHILFVGAARFVVSKENVKS